MNNKEVIKWLNKNRPCISMTCNKENADKINIAIDKAIKAIHIVDIINEELSPADEDKAIWFDIPYEWLIDGHHYKCSRCGKTLAIMFSETDDDDLIGCPFCLADMGAKEEAENE